jgi:succinate dehydrogenase / fumarate reductase iron-sulfur subunit
MEITIHIARSADNQTPSLQSYVLDVEPKTTILDCLNRIKWEQDGSLAFRKNCRNAICGSCAIRINDRPFLACNENIESIFNWLEGSNQIHNQQFTLRPLGNLPVIKDLIVNMTPFWNDLEKVQPRLIHQSRAYPPQEFRQTPQEREELNQVANCILCGVCYSDCDAKGKNAEFVGPHALAKAHRLIMDSRDTATQKRLEQHSEGMKGVWGCNGCKMCNDTCPMGVAPMSQIETMRVRIFDLLDPL